MCPYCNILVFIKVERVSLPLLAPLTPEDALYQEWANKSGQDFVVLQNKYCPMCGKEVKYGSNN